MESPSPKLPFQDVLMLVLSKSNIQINPLRTNVHAIFHKGLERNDHALQRVLRDKIVFNRWRNGPISEDIDTTLDDLLFYELIQEKKEHLELSEKGRAYLDKELSSLNPEARQHLDGVAQLLIEEK